MDRPIRVCLCGSMRRDFADVWKREYRKESIEGKIVLIAAVVPGDDPIENTDDLKPGLDLLHKRKIDLADEILVLNVGGYVGDSTRSEIEYAKNHGKLIRWLEPPLRGFEQAIATVLVLLGSDCLSAEEKATVSERIAATRSQIERSVTQRK
jgi:hypothetical protein